MALEPVRAYRPPPPYEAHAALVLVDSETGRIVFRQPLPRRYRNLPEATEAERRLADMIAAWADWSRG
jgi:hypothetical protein